MKECFSFRSSNNLNFIMNDDITILATFSAGFAMEGISLT